MVLAFLLAGWGVAALSRLMAAAILEHLERVARLSDHLSTQATQGLALLERIAEAWNDRDAIGRFEFPHRGSSGPDRWPRSCGPIEAADWVEAETRSE